MISFLFSALVLVLGGASAADAPKYSVKDQTTNRTCLIVQATISLSISYTNQTTNEVTSLYDRESAGMIVQTLLLPSSATPPPPQPPLFLYHPSSSATPPPLPPLLLYHPSSSTTLPPLPPLLLSHPSFSTTPRLPPLLLYHPSPRPHTFD